MIVFNFKDSLIFAHLKVLNSYGLPVLLRHYKYRLLYVFNVPNEAVLGALEEHTRIVPAGSDFHILGLVIVKDV